MMKKLLLTFILVLPFGARCDMPTQTDQAAARAKARAAWNSMNEQDRENTYTEQEIYRLRQEFPELSDDNARIIVVEEKNQRKNEQRKQQNEQEIIQCLEILLFQNPELDNEQLIQKIRQAAPAQRQEWLDAHTILQERINAERQKMWLEQRTRTNEQQDTNNQIKIILIQNPKLSYQDAQRMVEEATPQQRQEWLNAYNKKEQEVQIAQWNRARNSLNTARPLDAVELCQVGLGCTALVTAGHAYDLKYVIPKLPAQFAQRAAEFAQRAAEFTQRAKEASERAALAPAQIPKFVALAAGCVLAIGAIEAGKYLWRNFYKNGKKS